MVGLIKLKYSGFSTHIIENVLQHPAKSYLIYNQGKEC